MLRSLRQWLKSIRKRQPAANRLDAGGASPPTLLIYSPLAAHPQLDRLVDLFVEEMPKRINALQAHAGNRDWYEVGRLAHQLKGAAGSYGFHEITPCAAALEAAARGGQPERAKEALDELVRLCRSVRAGTPEPSIASPAGPRKETPPQ